MKLPLVSPYPPMEARTVDAIPAGPEWQYEPKWDGFRCLAFREGSHIELQSKSGQPLTRYFPDLVESLQSLRAVRFVLDGEIVIPVNGFGLEPTSTSNASGFGDVCRRFNIELFERC